MSAYRRDLPLIRVGGWRAKAACTERVMDRLWDDRLDHETDKQRDARHEEGKAICNDDCPVRAKCSAEADWRIDEGIRGGHLLPSLGSALSASDQETLRLLRLGVPLDDAAGRSRAS